VNSGVEVVNLGSEIYEVILTSIEVKSDQSKSTTVDGPVETDDPVSFCHVIYNRFVDWPVLFSNPYSFIRMHSRRKRCVCGIAPMKAINDQTMSPALSRRTHP
jgi:hypothetical protein